VRRVIVILTALATALALALPAVSAAETESALASTGKIVEKGEFDSYIVVMAADPLVATEGKDNLDTPRARNRGQQMKASHDRVLRDAGVNPDKKVSDYVYALNGFAAHITYDEAVRIAGHKEVAFILPDELYQAHTDSSPTFLGLDGRGGAWSTGVTGKGVVVGIIDTGIWPEHPSFSPAGISAPPVTLQDLVVGGPTGAYPIPACNFGNTAHNPNDAAFDCNNKLVGARQVLPSYRQLIGAEDFEFDSARDDDGHGTHTASTAAGNGGVAAEIFDNELGSVSGIAPDAHIIAYKGLGSLGGFGSDLALAIDIAVFDGVDVINYSIGGGATGITVDEIAFLFAADAGVHIATSAGNSGPGAATVRSPAKVPWLTTVGASTQERFWQGTVELGDASTYTGASITPGTNGVFPLVDAADAGDDLCRLNQLDPEVVEGAIVLCRRGAPARIMTSAEVQRAGGVGVILYNNSDVDNLFTDNFHVPTVHIDNTPGLAIKEYIASADQDATAEIRDTATESTWASAPSMAVFSSRGPNVFADVIKPDVTAPGFQILAGNSPFPGPIIGGTVPRVQGEMFQSIAGTSMSSPHVAGLFALIKQANPTWSAAAARSALMTTAHQDVVDNDRSSATDPFDFGSGHVDPGRAVARGSAFQPGLVYEAGFNDYLGFLCDAFPGVFSNPAATCAALAAAGIPTDASDLNYPSIAVADLPGTTTVTRTVTSVAREGGNRQYTVSVEAPPGYSVAVSPSTLTLRRGQSATYQVTIVNESAPVGEWRFGSLTWTDRSGGYEVQSPVAVRGVPLAAPDEVTFSGESGAGSFDVFFGYTGPYEATGLGLVGDTGDVGMVEQDPNQTFSGCSTPLGDGEVAHSFDLTGTAHLRITMDQGDVDGPGETDIDLFLCRGNSLVASSTSPNTAEQIDLSQPADGSYTLIVHGWGVPSGTVDYTFHLWDIPLAGGGSLVIDDAPASAIIGTVGTVEFSWSGASGVSMGAVAHSDGTDLLGMTLVTITD
jgi:subtilisin family serine protease